MISPFCLLLAITFYPAFVPEPWPVGQEWVILPSDRLPTLYYALHSTSSRYGEIERTWLIPYEYCVKEGFE